MKILLCFFVLAQSLALYGKEAPRRHENVDNCRHANCKANDTKNRKNISNKEIHIGLDSFENDMKARHPLGAGRAKRALYLIQRPAQYQVVKQRPAVLVQRPYMVQTPVLGQAVYTLDKDRHHHHHHDDSKDNDDDDNKKKGGYKTIVIQTPGTKNESGTNMTIHVFKKRRSFDPTVGSASGRFPGHLLLQILNALTTLLYAAVVQ